MLVKHPAQLTLTQTPLSHIFKEERKRDREEGRREGEKGERKKGRKERWRKEGRKSRQKFKTNKKKAACWSPGPVQQ